MREVLAQAGGTAFTRNLVGTMHEQSPTRLLRMLQVSPNADVELIQRVFRLLARRYHPDNARSGNATVFRQLHEAYTVLNDPEKRAAADAIHVAQRQNHWRTVAGAGQAENDFEAEQALRLTLLEVFYSAGGWSRGRQCCSPLNWKDSRELPLNISSSLRGSWCRRACSCVPTVPVSASRRPASSISNSTTPRSPAGDAVFVRPTLQASPTSTSRARPRRMSKPPTVFLGEMTNPEVEAFLKTHHTVIIPTGATEQHGPHGPLLTDVLIPQEIARRVAPQIGARGRAADQLRAVVSARRVHRPRAHPHSDVHGADRGSVRVVRHRRVQADHLPERPLRQHLRDRVCLRQRRRAACRKDVKAFPVNYWDGLTAEEVAEFSGLKNGLHANLAETSAVLAINPDLVDMERANAEFPPFPEFTVQHRRRCTPRSSSPRPGRSTGRRNRGTWGDARGSTPEIGERYLRRASSRRSRCSRTSRRRSRRCRDDDSRSGRRHPPADRRFQVRTRKTRGHRSS